MNFKFFILVFTITLCNSCSETKNELQSLNGSDWLVKQADQTNYIAATVPGTIQTDLLKLDKIPDPFLLTNEDSIQWVSEKDWVYSKTFSIAPETLQKKYHILKFDGLDTYAEVSLNDSIILKADNAFRRWEVDVSSLLTSENKLSILLKSVDAVEIEKASKIPYTLPEAPRVFTRKPQFQYGWDWGPKIKTMGVFRDVSILSFDKMRLQDVSIATMTISEEKATLRAQIEVAGNDDSFYDIIIENLTTGAIKKMREKMSSSSTVFETTFVIDNPKLWWTHNLGNPHLYDFKVSLKKDGITIDSKKQKIGVRTIELVTEKDSIGESFYFKLNDEPVYMKGANYIPQNIFLPEVTQRDREKLIDNVVDANMNMLRVWGGGIYEDDSFYNLCDEKGILIWQDFMFACAMYPGDKQFLENIKEEAIDNVKRLRNHPSIALWCGNNENSEGWHRWGWQTDKTEDQKEEIWNNYQAVFNDILPSVVDSLIPSISYWESSPKYGRGDKRYQFEGDAHDWWVWHDGYPFEHFEEEVPRFMSEFGFQSFPSYEAIKYFTQQDNIDISHSSFATHQKHSRGFDLIIEYMSRDFPVPANDEEYVYVSQLLQAHGISKGIRAHRLAKPYNMGTLYWQLNDCWPVVSWSSIDGLGNWKALHYEAKKAFENVLPIAWEEDEKLKVTVVNDLLKTITDTLHINIKDFDGNLIKSNTINNVRANNKNDVTHSISLADFEFDPAQSFAEIIFANKRAIYYFERPKDLKLSSKPPQFSKISNEEGVLIKLTAETLQKNVFLFSEDTGHFSDNFFDLLPGEEKTIQFFSKKQSLESIKYKTLNAFKF